uniref:Uncharacterized protein n=1 Tax=Anguilla anguilla TaxID=7936 RepID=A0A0E9QBV9_ANGAN
MSKFVICNAILIAAVPSVFRKGELYLATYTLRLCDVC